MTVTVSVGRILEGAFGLIRERFGALAIWAALGLAMNLALLLAFQPMLASAMGGADPSEIVGAVLPAYAIAFVMALVGMVTYTAAMRAVLRPEAVTFGYLRLGLDELRIFALCLIFAVASFLIAFALVMAFGIVGAGFAFASQSPVATVLLSGLASLGILLLFVFLLLRFSLAFPLTLHRRRLVVGEAWRLSKGRFWTLFGAALVVTVIGFVLMTVTGIFTAGSYLADLMAASGDAEASAAAMEAQLTRVGTFSPAMILQTIAGAATGAIWVALSGGSAATAAKLLLADEFDDAERVFG